MSVIECVICCIYRISYQILQSLLMLAEHDVIHCDLKPEVYKKYNKNSKPPPNFFFFCKMIEYYVETARENLYQSY